jgi:hypothetical protein
VIAPRRDQLLVNPLVAGLVPINDFATDERAAAADIRNLINGQFGM